MNAPDPTRRRLLKAGIVAPILPVCARASAADDPAPPPSFAGRETPPRRVIMMISDGMSPSVPLLAESFSRMTRQRGTHWQHLARTPATVHGLLDMSSLDSPVTDSAAACSAWASGVRVHNGSINVLPDGTVLTPIGPLVRDSGRALGLVTTTRITHATPAGFAAAVRRRADEDAVAQQYLGAVDLLLGGGAKHFAPEHRSDGVDLLARFREEGYAVITHADDLPAWNVPPRMIGLFGDDHLPYTIDHEQCADLRKRVPSLATLTKTALRALTPNPNGFLLQIEGGRVDHAAHANDAAGMLHDQLAFDDALGVALGFVREHDDTLLIVTTDHGCANPGLNGMGSRYRFSGEHLARCAPIRSSLERLERIARTLYRDRNDITDEQLRTLITGATDLSIGDDETGRLRRALHRDRELDANHQQRCFLSQLGQIMGNHIGIQWTGVTHTADPALLMATGPGSAALHGFQDGTAVFGHLAAIFGVAHRNEPARAM